MFILDCSFIELKVNAGLSQAGGPRGPVPPHFLTDQLTLSQPGGAHYPHPVICALPDFQTLRRPCTGHRARPDWADKFPDRTGPDTQICQTGPAEPD